MGSDKLEKGKNTEQQQRHNQQSAKQFSPLNEKKKKWFATGHKCNQIQTSVSYISDSVSHLAQEIVFCVKRFQEYGLEGHRTPGLIEQLAAERS